jgi:tRNA threonylcarbamoyladenosine biosynthesis protein TsaE
MKRQQLVEFESENESQTNDFAAKVVHFFTEGDTILLYGNLGSGKTYLVKQFVKALGVKEEVTSPTFAIINQYSGPVLINHIDLYRIADSRELVNLGLEDIWEMQSINFVEWPQLIEQQIRLKHYRITISVIQHNLRYRRFSLDRFCA